MSLLWDSDAARETAGTYLGAAHLLSGAPSVVALAAAGALVDDAAVLAQLRGDLDEGLALQQDCRDHADELRNAALLVERHEGIVVAAVRDLRHLLGPVPLVTVGLGGLESLLHLLPFAAPPVHLLETPAGPEWSLGARSVADWMQRCDRLADGTFAISVLGDGQVVVVLPGIHSLGERSDVRDLPGAARELLTGASGYHEAVVAALQGMALPPGARLTLIGHSQGGIVAMDLSRDPRVARIGPVTHVVTAGSPIDGIRPPPGTSLLEAVNPDDGVPALDGRPPQAGPGHVVVTGLGGPVTQSHTLSGSPQAYATLLSLPGVLGRADVAGFLRSGRGWLGGEPAQTTIVTALDGPPGGRSRRRHH